MTDEGRWERLRQLAVMPPLAALDHRHFLDERGKDTRLAGLSRKERRRLETDGRRLATKYYELIRKQFSTGAGYPIDQMIHGLAAEYNHRYAASGTATQPTSFNYVEPFLSLHYFEKSFAPHLNINPELDHLFFLNDFLEFLTEPPRNEEELSSVFSSVPNGRIFNYTSNGIPEDNVYTTADGAEFIFSGFSFVKHGSYVSWVLVGGEIIPEEEWIALADESFDLSALSPYKRKFLAKAIEINGATSGLPIPLQGTERAIRKVLAGELDLTSERHLSRCLMSEYENAFMVQTDDPAVLSSITSKTKRQAILENAQEALSRGGALWTLASALLYLPRYFEEKVDLVDKIRLPKRPSGLSTTLPSGGFSYVSSIQSSGRSVPNSILSYAPREFLMESSGWWKPLAQGSVGRGVRGEPVRNRTWVDTAVEWRENPQNPRTIYVKSTLSEAKQKVAALEAAAAEVAVLATAVQSGPCLYVLRCTTMEGGVFKIGWTTGTAAARAKELSAATGVPLAFIVVREHTHEHARELEAGVHAALAPYRINTAREFFRVDVESIDRAISIEIARVDRK